MQRCFQILIITLVLQILLTSKCYVFSRMQSLCLLMLISDLIYPLGTGYRRADPTCTDDFRSQWWLWRKGQTGEQMHFLFVLLFSCSCSFSSCTTSFIDNFVILYHLLCLAETCMSLVLGLFIYLFLSEHIQDLTVNDIRPVSFNDQIINVDTHSISSKFRKLNKQVIMTFW